MSKRRREEARASRKGSESGPPKKKYSPPALIEYGDIAKLTQSGPSGVPEGFSGMAMF